MSYLMMYNCHARWMEHSTNLWQKLQYNIGFYLCCTIYKSCDVSSKLSDKREIVFFKQVQEWLITRPIRQCYSALPLREKSTGLARPEFWVRLWYQKHKLATEKYVSFF